jgi:Cu2+-containing amine oxidase
MWPAGKYVTQTRDHPSDSVGNWCNGNDSLEDQDIVLFLTLGINHIPHPEQWPVYDGLLRYLEENLTDLQDVGREIGSHLEAN